MMAAFTPSYDNKIAQKYSANTIENKAANKTALQKELGWPEEKRMPVICLPLGVDSSTGGELLQAILPGIDTLGVELLILGRGDEKFGREMSALAADKKHRIAIIKDDEVEQRKMYAAADIALFCSDPTNVAELQHCLNYGVVPVSLRTKALEDYNPIQERGTSFMYDKADQWHCFAALVRALETYRFPYDWRTIQRLCMETEK